MESGKKVNPKVFNYYLLYFHFICVELSYSIIILLVLMNTFSCRLFPSLQVLFSDINAYEVCE